MLWRHGEEVICWFSQPLLMIFTYYGTFFCLVYYSYPCFSATDQCNHLQTTLSIRFLHLKVQFICFLSSLEVSQELAWDHSSSFLFLTLFCFRCTWGNSFLSTFRPIIAYLLYQKQWHHIHSPHLNSQKHLSLILQCLSFMVSKFTNRVCVPDCFDWTLTC